MPSDLITGNARKRALPYEIVSDGQELENGNEGK
jgi:hypothetical protein